MIATSQQMKIPPYALIVGQGRSGTNWLLELLDLSPRTHCRNEPNEIEGSLLAGLPSPHIDQPMPARFEKAWDAAVTAAASTMGERDRHAAGRKGYTWEPVRLLGGRQLVMKERSRHVLATVMPSLRRREWRMPWWLGHRGGLARAMPVLKFTQTPGWACWVLRHLPDVPVIHITRHPAGFLNSWAKRFLADRDHGMVRHENEERLREIARIDRQWAERFGDIDAMSVEQSELWYWVYANETIHAVGRSAPGYVHVVYERVAADPLAAAREMFAQCGLEIDDRIERGVRATAAKSKCIVAKWREQLPPAHVALANHVLRQTPMQTWWNGL